MDCKYLPEACKIVRDFASVCNYFLSLGYSQNTSESKARAGKLSPWLEENLGPVRLFSNITYRIYVHP
jgi:hypothetical protein